MSVESMTTRMRDVESMYEDELKRMREENQRVQTELKLTKHRLAKSDKARKKHKEYIDNTKDEGMGMGGGGMGVGGRVYVHKNQVIEMKEHMMKEHQLEIEKLRKAHRIQIRMNETRVEDLERVAKKTEEKMQKILERGILIEKHEAERSAEFKRKVAKYGDMLTAEKDKVLRLELAQKDSEKMIKSKYEKKLALYDKMVKTCEKTLASKDVEIERLKDDAEKVLRTRDVQVAAEKEKLAVAIHKLENMDTIIQGKVTVAQRVCEDRIMELKSEIEVSKNKLVDNYYKMDEYKNETVKNEKDIAAMNDQLASLGKELAKAKKELLDEMDNNKRLHAENERNKKDLASCLNTIEENEADTRRRVEEIRKKGDDTIIEVTMNYEHKMMEVKNDCKERLASTVDKERKIELLQSIIEKLKLGGSKALDQAKTGTEKVRAQLGTEKKKVADNEATIWVLKQRIEGSLRELEDLQAKAKADKEASEEEILKLKNEVGTKQNKIIEDFNKIGELKEALEAANKKYQDVAAKHEKEVEDLTKEHTFKLEREVSEVASELEDLKKNKDEHVRKEASSVLQAYKALFLSKHQKEVVTYKKEIEALGIKIKKAELDYVDLTVKFKSGHQAIEKVKEHEKTIKALKEQSEKDTEEMVLLVEQMEKQRDYHTDLKDIHASKSKEQTTQIIEECDKKIAKCIDIAKETEGKLVAKEEELAATKKELEELKVTFQAGVESLGGEHQEQIEEMRLQIDQSSKEINLLEEDLEEAEKKYKELFVERQNDMKEFSKKWRQSQQRMKKAFETKMKQMDAEARLLQTKLAAAEQEKDSMGNKYASEVRDMLSQHEQDLRKTKHEHSNLLVEIRAGNERRVEAMAIEHEKALRGSKVVTEKEWWIHSKKLEKEAVAKKEREIANLKADHIGRVAELKNEHQVLMSDTEASLARRLEALDAQNAKKMERMATKHKRDVAQATARKVAIAEELRRLYEDEKEVAAKLREEMKESKQKLAKVVAKSGEKVKLLEEETHSLQAQLRKQVAAAKKDWWGHKEKSQVELEEKKKHIAELKAEMKKLQYESLAEVEFLKDHHEGQLQKLDEQHRERFSELEETHRDSIATLETRHKESIKAAEERASALQASEQDSISKSIGALGLISQHETTVNEIHKDFEEKMNQLEKSNKEAKDKMAKGYEKRINFLRDSIKAGKQAKEGLVKGHEDAMGKVKDFYRDKVSTLEKEHKTAKSEVEKLEGKLAAHENKLEGKLAAHGNSLEIAKNAIRIVNAKLKEKEREVEVLKVDKENLRTELEEKLRSQKVEHEKAMSKVSMGEADHKHLLIVDAEHEIEIYKTKLEAKEKEVEILKLEIKELTDTYYQRMLDYSRATGDSKAELVAEERRNVEALKLKVTTMNFNVETLKGELESTKKQNRELKQRWFWKANEKTKSLINNGGEDPALPSKEETTD